MTITSSPNWAVRPSDEGATHLPSLEAGRNAVPVGSYPLVESTRQHHTYLGYAQDTVAKPCVNQPVIHRWSWSRNETETNSQSVKYLPQFRPAGKAVEMQDRHCISSGMQAHGFHELFLYRPLSTWSTRGLISLVFLLFGRSGALFFGPCSVSSSSLGKIWEKYTVFTLCLCHASVKDQQGWHKQKFGAQKAFAFVRQVVSEPSLHCIPSANSYL